MDAYIFHRSSLQVTFTSVVLAFLLLILYTAFGDLMFNTAQLKYSGKRTGNHSNHIYPLDEVRNRTRVETVAIETTNQRLPSLTPLYYYAEPPHPTSRSPVATTNQSTTTPSTDPKGYVIVEKYTEQLESALYDFYQLAGIAEKWQLQILEPLMDGTYYRLPEPNIEFLRFSDAYNFSATVRIISQESFQSSYPVIATLEEFAAHVPNISETVLVNFGAFGQSHCDSFMQKQTARIEGKLNAVVNSVGGSKLEGTNKNKRIKFFSRNSVCFDVRRAIDFASLSRSDSVLSAAFSKASESHSKVLVLILAWNGVRKKKVPFFYYDPNLSLRSCGKIHQLPHSATVLKATNRYMHFLNIQRPIFAVHIRLERLIISEKYDPGHMTSCTNQLITAARNIMSKFRIHSNQTIAIRDYSGIGSETCSRKGCYGVAKQLGIDTRLKALGINPAQYRTPRDVFPNKKGTANFNGFSSLVEKELLSSSAEYLLTVGHGSYQQSVSERFLAGHDKERLFALCSQYFTGNDEILLEPNV